MIAFINGILKEKQPTHAVIEKDGIGFELLIPMSTFAKLPDVGQPVQLYSHLHVREDAINLIGFAEREEKELFQLLLTVSGIGMRSALGILSGCKVNEFYTFIVQGDEAALTRIPGLGKKTAQRLILDLKDKAAAKLPAMVGVDKKKPKIQPALFDEAMEAMMSLGYSRAEAMRAIEKAAEIVGDSPTIEELLQVALKAR